MLGNVALEILFLVSMSCVQPEEITSIAFIVMNFTNQGFINGVS